MLTLNILVCFALLYFMFNFINYKLETNYLKKKNHHNENTFVELTFFEQESIYDIALSNLNNYHSKKTEKGVVLSFMDGIVLVSGLPKLKVGGVVSIGEHKILGTVLNLEKNFSRVLLSGGDSLISTGDVVLIYSMISSIKVNYDCLGRVFDPLGNAIDGLPSIHTILDDCPIEAKGPGILDRQPIYESLETGILAVDSMVPVGHGQRELIIGDRQTGKTSLAFDTIVNQGKAAFKNSLGLSTVCVYVSVGNRVSEAGFLLSLLKKHKALSYTAMIVSGASSSANLQYIAPYAGTALAEWFVRKGHPVVIAYDDLTKHAVAYRQLALLLRRPPGREAFPGDVFYLHARLLERSAKLAEIKFGGGSLTALPIVETQVGDVSAYIPTNVISITDGQIYLEAELFARGIRPAINFGLSVSRVGTAAQCKAMRSVSGNLKLELAQFREASKFSAFAADLDDTTKLVLHRGACLTQLLKQNLFDSIDMKSQVMFVMAGVQGHLDILPVIEITQFKKDLM